jgi:hypothetical protein
MMAMQDRSRQVLDYKYANSYCPSRLKIKDEWTEIELYNGILAKMRKEFEVKEK